MISVAQMRGFDESMFFLAIIILHTCCTLQLHTSKTSRASRMLQQVSLPFSLVNTHLHSSCTAVLVFCSEPFSLIMQKSFVYIQLKETSQCYCFYSQHCCQQSGSKFIDSSSWNLSCCSCSSLPDD